MRKEFPRVTPESVGIPSAAVEKLLSVPGMTDEMGRRAASASPADANDRIFGEILELVSGGRSGK